MYCLQGTIVKKSSGRFRISHRGRGPHREAVDPRGSYVLKILHVKTKESGPVGGGACRSCPLDPPMKSVAMEKIVVKIIQSMNNVLPVRHNSKEIRCHGETCCENYIVCK